MVVTRMFPTLALLVVLVAGTTTMMMRGAEAQQPSCAAQLTQLAPCARFSVPPAPAEECCSALGAVSHDCACGTLDIINSLPAKCGLPRVTCQ